MRFLDALGLAAAILWFCFGVATAVMGARGFTDVAWIYCWAARGFLLIASLAAMSFALRKG